MRQQHAPDSTAFVLAGKKEEKAKGEGTRLGKRKNKKKGQEFFFFLRSSVAAALASSMKTR